MPAAARCTSAAARTADRPCAQCATTLVAAGAVIDASATGTGDGGQVTVWSDQTTHLPARSKRAAARMAAMAGGSRHREVQSLGVALGPGGCRGPMGKAGNWLLDPEDLLVNYTNNNISPPTGPSATSPTLTPTGVNASVDARVVSATLNGGTNVILTTVGAPGAGNGDITVNAFVSPPVFQSISWTTPTQLTLNAAGNISILTPISGSNTGSTLALNSRTSSHRAPLVA